MLKFIIIQLTRNRDKQIEISKIAKNTNINKNLIQRVL